MNKEVLDKVYLLISTKLDNCYYKNCKKGRCQDLFFVSHSGNCEDFFKEVTQIIWHTYVKLANDNGFPVDDIQESLDFLNTSDQNISKSILDRFEEMINLETQNA